MEIRRPHQKKVKNYKKLFLISFSLFFLTTLWIFFDLMGELKQRETEFLYVKSIINQGPERVSETQWANLFLKCATKDALINSSTSRYKFYVEVSNKFEQAIVINAPVQNPIHIRPRLWNDAETKIVRDGIGYHLLLTEKPIVIGPHAKLEKAIYLDAGDLSSVMEQKGLSGRFTLRFDFVQEGVQWSDRSHCRFKVKLPL